MDAIALTVDFADPDDIVAKLPIARAALDRKRRETEGLEKLVDLLTLLAPDDAPPSDDDDDDRNGRADHVSAASADHAAPSDAAPVDLVVGVVLERGRRIRSLEVAKALRDAGHDISNTTVSNSLHYAANRAKPPRIKSVQGRGYYAPLDYDDGRSPNAESPDDRGAVVRGFLNGANFDQSLNRDAVERISGDRTGSDPPGGSV